MKDVKMAIKEQEIITKILMNHITELVVIIKFSLNILYDSFSMKIIAEKFIFQSMTIITSFSKRDVRLSNVKK